MITCNLNKGIFSCCVFSALFLGAFTVSPAEPVTLQEIPLPSRTFEIEGGTIQVLGGILVSLGPRVALTRNKDHLRLEYLVTVRNQSSRDVWVEVEFPLPGTQKIHRKRQKIKSKKEQRFAWQVKKAAIHWDAEYTFTVSVFTGKKKSLGAESYSFLFDEAKRNELETVQIAMMEVLGSDKLGNTLVSGWPEGPAVALQKNRSDQALLVFYRSKKRTGRTSDPLVFVDGAEVAKLDNGRFFSLYVKPGIHEIKSDMSNHPQIEIDASTGEVVYLEMIMMVGGHQGTGRISQASAGPALKEIAKTKPLSRKLIRDHRVIFEFEASEATQQARQEEPPAIPTEKGLHILAVKFKVTEENDVSHRIAWRVTVLNNTVQAKKFDLTLQFFDSDNSLIAEDQKDNLIFRARAQKVISGFSMVTAASARQVKTVGASIAR